MRTLHRESGPDPDGSPPEAPSHGHAGQVAVNRRPGTVDMSAIPVPAPRPDPLLTGRPAPGRVPASSPWRVDGPGHALPDTERARRDSTGHRDARQALIEACVLTAVFLFVGLVAAAGLWVGAAHALRDELRQDLMRLASAAASTIDVGLHERIRDPEQIDTPEYVEAVRPLRRFLAHTPGVRYIYTAIRAGDDVRFILDAAEPGDHDNDGVEDRAGVFEVYDNADPAIFVALGTDTEPGRPFSSGQPFTDRWGSFVTGFAPLVDGDGRQVGVAGVDILADVHLAHLAGVRRKVALGGLPAAVLALASGVGFFHFRRRALATARARSESEAGLARSMRLLVASQRAARIGSWSVDGVGGRVAWSGEMYRLLARPEHLGPPQYAEFLAHLPAVDGERLDAAVQKALRDGTPFVIEHAVRRPNAPLRWLETRGSLSDDGRTVHGTAQDVTERRLASDRLRRMIDELTRARDEQARQRRELGRHAAELEQTQARLRAFVAHAPAAVAMFDRDVTYIAASERWIEDYGLRDTLVVGRTHYEVFPNIPDRWRAVHQRCLAGAVERSDDDSWRPEGWTEDQHLQWEVRPWYDQDGSIGGIIMYSKDITAEKRLLLELDRAREAAEAANRTKSEFIANMSHEIRTPLTAILGYADLLRESTGTGTGEIEAERRSHIETIVRAGEHLLTIINDLLDLSKIEADCMTVERVPLRPGEVISEVMELMAPRAREKGIELAVHLADPALPVMLGDPTRLRQIAMNLIGNAVKFTSEGSVTVTIDRRTTAAPCVQDLLIVDVCDTGPGIADQAMPLLFQPFSQSDASVTRRHGGTGLGLAISRRLARILGGDVTLEFTRPGQGSRFRATLPITLAPERRRSTATTPAAAPSSGSRGADPAPTLYGRVLLVEDGIDNQRLIAFHLRRAGAAVQVAENGQQALESIERAQVDGSPFDLVVTDVQMPVMDGLTLTARLRAAGCTLPIIALTAHASAEDRDRAIAAGCSDFATKPIDAPALLRACARWMSSGRAATPDRAPATGAR